MRGKRALAYPAAFPATRPKRPWLFRHRVQVNQAFTGTTFPKAVQAEHGDLA